VRYIPIPRFGELKEVGRILFERAEKILAVQLKTVPRQSHSGGIKIQAINIFLVNGLETAIFSSDVPGQIEQARNSIVGRCYTHFPGCLIQLVD
jgi:hypothetical protein